MLNNHYADFVTESWKIEGLILSPLDLVFAVDRHQSFVQAKQVSVDSLTAMASLFAGARLRYKPGMDVQVGDHLPPYGGIEVIERLKDLCMGVNEGAMTCPLEVHKSFESLHPFMDGNGRVGRLMWLWMMVKANNDMWKRYGFLQTWYYQSLSSAGLI